MIYCIYATIKGHRLPSLGPVVNILVKRYHIKGIGCPLSILINIVIGKRKERKNDQTGTQATDFPARIFKYNFFPPGHSYI